MNSRDETFSSEVLKDFSSTGSKQKALVLKFISPRWGLKNILYNKKIHKNKEMDEKTLPPYFKGVEGESKTIISSNFTTYYPRIRKHFRQYERNAWLDHVYEPKFTKLESFWPIGSISENYINYVDITPLQKISYDSSNLLDIERVAKDYFMLPTSAVSSVLDKKTSLFHQVKLAYQLHDVVDQAYFEVKEGVYYMLHRGTVVKFLKDVNQYSEFMTELIMGLHNYINNSRIKGAVGIKNYCPQGMCVEMEFEGISLNDVINGGMNYIINNKDDPRNRHRIERQIAAVKMLYVNNRLPQKISEKKIDYFFAAHVIECMKAKLYNDLPFVMVEIINITTRLSNHGLINPDIKEDNIVIDGLTGQPKIIDFELIFPENRRSPFWDRCEEEGYTPTISSIYNMVNASHHVAAEYFTGDICQRTVMTYSLCCLFDNVLKQKKYKDIVDRLLNNPMFMECITRGLADDPENRPSLVKTLIPVIGACFPLKKEIAQQFLV